nr:vomeronasal type-1 receptor 1-like isoform X1 [Paramormyrops kingsleyae]
MSPVYRPSLPAMESESLIRGLLFLFLTVVGVPGNSLVIWAFVRVARHDRRLLPADAIVLHLVSVNLLVVVVRCLPETLATFRLAAIFNDASCRGIIYVFRTARTLSIWLTFVLSAYQCLSAAPPGSRWAQVRATVAHHLGFIFLALWLVNCIISCPAAIYSLGSRGNSSLMEHSINAQFCLVQFPSGLARDANGAVQTARDVVPMAFMTTASIIILVFLYRHSQQVKGLRGGAGGKSRPSAERRAAKSVVTLVTMYVVFYGVDNGLWVYTITVTQTLSSALVSDLRVFFASLYASVSPIVIIISNTKVSRQLQCQSEENAARGSDAALSPA